MLKRSTVVLLIAVVCLATAFAQDLKVRSPKLTPQTSGTTQLLIAVSPVNENVVWAAGTGGTFVKTTDGGNTWTSGVVPGAENLQFRDVQGISDQEAYLLSIGNNTTSFRIYKTEDGGATWTTEFTNLLASAFYDCFAFWSPDRALAHSDSVNGVFPEMRTNDGTTWYSIAGNMPPALSGEASFSSSGTCITTQGQNNAWVTTGGASVARILTTTDGGFTWNAYNTPLVSNAAAGGFSVAFRDAMNGVVGGGDLSNNGSADMASSNDGGATWTLTTPPPVRGAIFCLAYVRGMRFRTEDDRAPFDPRMEHVVVVTSEILPNFDAGSAAWTPDEGQTWYAMPTVSGYWAVAFASPKAGWFVGNNGQILKISF